MGKYFDIDRVLTMSLSLFLFTLIGSLVYVAIALSGCASAPVSNLGDITKGETQEAITDVPLPEGCTQSTLAKPGDQYSYQGPIDPQTIYNDWVEILKLRQGDYRMGAMCYKNPDFNADITAAELVMQAGVCAAFCYLQDGEPMAFIYVLLQLVTWRWRWMEARKRSLLTGCLKSYILTVQRFNERRNMIIPRLGRWSSSSGSIFIWDRLYLHGYKWTPLCRVRFRYLHTLNNKQEVTP